MSVRPYVERWGRGRPILFVHGFGATTYTWRHLVPALSERHRVILVDLKGSGRSPKPVDDRYSPYDQAEMLSAFIRQDGLQDLTLVGHSLGGGAVLATIRALGQDRRRLARLILIDTVAYRQRFPYFIRLLRAPMLGPLGLWLVPTKLQVSIIMRFAYHDPSKVTRDAIEAYARPLRSPGARRALIRTAREIIPHDIDAFVESYARIELPTLIVWGREDRIVPLEVGEKLHRAIRSSRLVVIGDCGHLPHEERPAEVVTPVCAFLDGQDV